MADNRYKKLSTNTVLFALGTVGSKAIGFFLVPFYTNILSTFDYGVADLISTLSSLLLPLFSVSMGESILFYGLQADDEELKQRYFKNGFTVVLFGCALLALLSPLFQMYHALDGYTLFLPCYAILEIIRTYLKCYVKSSEKNTLFAIDNIAYAFVFAALNIFFLAVFKLGIYGYLLAYILSEGVSVIFLLICCKGITKFISYKIDWNMMGRMVLYSVPLIFNSISWTIASSSDKIMLAAMLSNDAVGLYTSASKIPTILYTVGNLFCSAWTISAYLEVKNGDESFYANVFSGFNVFSFFVTCIALFLTRPFMYIYVGEAFREAVNYVPLLIIASVFQCYSAFFGSIVQSGKKNSLMLVSTVVSAIVNIILNYVLILRFDIYGACISTAISFALVFVLRFVFSRRVSSFPVQYFNLILSFVILTVQAIFVTLNRNIVVVSALSFLLRLLTNYKSVSVVWKRIVYTLFSKIMKKQQRSNN